MDQMNTSKPFGFRFVLNLLLFIIVLYAWVRMILGVGGSVLAASGLSNLRFYTVLSNLLEALACLIFCISCGRPSLRPFAEKLKYVAAVTISVTFLVVMVFLGPLFGYPLMLVGSNFWLHLIVPLAAVAEFLWGGRAALSFRHTLIAVVPLTVYGIGYLGNILLNGVGEWPNPNDFYGFVTWGLPIGIVIFAGLLGITLLIALLLRAVNRRLARKREPAHED